MSLFNIANRGVRLRRQRRMLLVGPTGNGKSLAMGSLFATLDRAEYRREFHVQLLDDRFLGQLDKIYLHDETDRTAGAEGLSIATESADICVAAVAGERLRVEGQVNIPALRALFREQNVDRLGLVINPFFDERLAKWSFLEMVWYWQTQKGFPLARCAELAAELLWSTQVPADEDKKGAKPPPHPFEALNVGWAGIEPLLDSARLTREPHARFGHDPEKVFSVEGVTPEEGARVLRVFARLACTHARRQSADQRVVRELARVYLDSSVIATCADLLEYLPGVTAGDLREVGYGIFSDRHAIRLSQVVVQGSKALALRRDPVEPIWRDGVADHADELIDSLLRRPLPDERSGWPTTSAAWGRPVTSLAVALLLTPILVTLAFLPREALITAGVFLGTWLVVHLFQLALGHQRTEKARPTTGRGSSPKPEGAPVNRIAALTEGNGKVEPVVEARP